MPERRTIKLDAAERDGLETMRRSHPKPYLRERAAAILKVADGCSSHWVARHGLLVERKPDQVYTWLDRYAEQGVEGLYIRTGRGRKPAFSPSAPEC